MNYPGVAPAFQMVRNGFDVWLGNSRGNKYSTGHTSLDPKSKQYWQFSYTEMGEFDAPAQIEEALRVSGVAKVSAWVGHSQGTSQMFAALSRNAGYWKGKLNLFVALAPVTSLTHSTSSLLKIAAKFEKPIVDAANLVGLY